MKGKQNEKNLFRFWCYNSRVFDNHTGSSGVCRTAVQHSSLRRSETIVTGFNSLCNLSTDWITCEYGSVTAEFVLLLPGVIMILLLALSLLSLQIQRVQLVQLAADGARLVAIGGTDNELQELVAETNFSVDTGINYKNQMVCYQVSLVKKIFWIGILPISETQCARKTGS